MELSDEKSHGVDIYVNFINSNAWYQTSGICTKMPNSSLQCNVDGDEGRFFVSNKLDKIQLNIEHLFLIKCGESESAIRNDEIKNGFYGITQGDDSVLVLKSMATKKFKEFFARNKCEWIP